MMHPIVTKCLFKELFLCIEIEKDRGRYMIPLFQNLWGNQISKNNYKAIFILCRFSNCFHQYKMILLF